MPTSGLWLWSWTVIVVTPQRSWDDCLQGVATTYEQAEEDAAESVLGYIGEVRRRDPHAHARPDDGSQEPIRPRRQGESASSYLGHLRTRNAAVSQRFGVNDQFKTHVKRVPDPRSPSPDGEAKRQRLLRVIA